MLFHCFQGYVSQTVLVVCDAREIAPKNAAKIRKLSKNTSDARLCVGRDEGAEEDRGGGDAGEMISKTSCGALLAPAIARL